MDVENIFGRLLDLGESWRIVQASFEEGTRTFIVQVEEVAGL